MSTSLQEAILDGFKKAGWLQPTEDVVRQIEYSVNQMDGRAGNEAEKDARRNKALVDIHALDPTNFVFWRMHSATLDAIIKEAQG